MAPDKPTKFEDIEWDSRNEAGVVNLSMNLKLLLVTGVPVLLFGLYDHFVVDEREATFVRLGEDFGFGAQFEALGLNFDLSSVDVLFVFTLFLFAWYVLLPLYQNPRMTRYYWTEFTRNRPAVASLVWLAIVFVGGVVGPFFIGMPEQDLTATYQPPVFMSVDNAHVRSCLGPVEHGRCHGTWEHILGTTRGGEDVLASVIHGMTVTMQIAFITTTIVAIIGITVGTLSAYAGGWVDELLMRFVDIVLSFPTLLFFLLILYIYGAGLGMFILVFALFGWGATSRYVRSKALSVSEEEFVKATRISGASTFRTIRHHVVPNTASSIITALFCRLMTTVSDALTVIFRQINPEMDAVWRYGIAQTACLDVSRSCQTAC